MHLTDKKITKALPKDKNYFLSDDEGLSLKISPSGLKTWTHRFTDPKTGKRCRVNIGKFPELNLRDARLKRDEQNILLSNGQSPLDNNSKNNKILTFSAVAQEWLDFKVKNSFGDNPRCGVLELAKKCIDNEFNPIIGDIEFKNINRINLVNVIRLIENRGVKEPVKKASSYLAQIYDYAVGVGYCDFNITIGINRILTKTKVKVNYAYLKQDELLEFVKCLQSYKATPVIKKALWLKIYTGVRGGEILQATADQFDLNNKIWRIPAQHVKQFRRKALHGVAVPDYIVPLSDQAVEVVRSAIEWSNGERYVFNSPRKQGEHIHFNSINSLIRRMGYKKTDITSHGIRSSMSTILNESGLFQKEWIEAQLSHTDKDKTRDTYNHAEYTEHRMKMMNWWGGFLNS